MPSIKTIITIIVVVALAEAVGVMSMVRNLVGGVLPTGK